MKYKLKIFLRTMINDYKMHFFKHRKLTHQKKRGGGGVRNFQIITIKIN